MRLDDAKIRAILTRQRYVTDEDLKRVEEYARVHHLALVEALLGQKLVTKTLLGQAIAESFQVQYFDLAAHEPTREILATLPEHVAQRGRLVVVAADANQFAVATDQPDNPKIKALIRQPARKKKITVHFSFSEDVDRALTRYRRPLGQRFLHILKQHSRVAPNLIDEIFKDAISSRASDIHLEPQDHDVAVRFRVDGVMFEAGRLPKAQYENVLNRVKIESRLRIDEHFAAQDGAMRQLHDGTPIDMRVSIVPTVDGEKIAIRLLSEYARGFTLSQLGLTEGHERLLLSAARKPFGMILVTGPTGSGKTTTLYALLKILNSPDINITTIEDPIEYKVAGINQIQVNLNTNLTFAQGLKSIVRQDPDVVLVGEIRDQETAEISVNAALTGHLLLSTFHANDAATAVPRLIEMGVEPFLVASTLELIIAQRLVRTICSVCRISQPTTAAEVAKQFPQFKKYFKTGRLTLYRGKGCTTCNGTGYQGRTAIYEFIPMTPALEELTLHRPSTQAVWQLAAREGARSLFEDGLEKVTSGLTTLDELSRVAVPT